MRLLSTGLAAGVFVAASAIAANAQSVPALVVNDLHHRMGPTSNSPSFGVIRGGATINAGPCSNGWCYAVIGGNAGYVAQQYVDFGGPPPGGYYAAPAPPPPVYGPPPPPPPVYGPPVPYPAYPPFHRSWDSRRW